MRVTTWSRKVHFILVFRKWNTPIPWNSCKFSHSKTPYTLNPDFSLVFALKTGVTLSPRNCIEPALSNIKNVQIFLEPAVLMNCLGFHGLKKVLLLLFRFQSAGIGWRGKGFVLKTSICRKYASSLYFSELVLVCNVLRRVNFMVREIGSELF